MKLVRTISGILLIAFSVIFSILPGSILFTLAGLVLLSIDYLAPRKLLRFTQKKMSTTARKADAWLFARKYR
ncbi:tellurium resistance protein TerC [Agaribacter marinus]|uniref:tellurium resistance protein TerC n=1 Tax=Agaribacter marinus TaxID=1431249 RepID=UPI0024E09F15|nr:tellurium resistance protein TerC [Agaribacter marinus]